MRRGQLLPSPACIMGGNWRKCGCGVTCRPTIIIGPSSAVLVQTKTRIGMVPLGRLETLSLPIKIALMRKAMMRR